MQKPKGSGEPTFSIAGPAGPLESMLSLPKGVGILCHPHPLYEGTMHNKVITTASNTLARYGMAALKFNFRGVQGSAGTYADGMGETDDAIAVYDWVVSHAAVPKKVVIGFSFGAFVAARLAAHREVDLLITIAPAVSNFDFDGLQNISCPWVVIQPEQDEVVPPEAVYQWVKDCPFSVELLKIPDASHFFHGKLVVLRERLSEILQNAL